MRKIKGLLRTIANTVLIALVICMFAYIFMSAKGFSFRKEDPEKDKYYIKSIEKLDGPYTVISVVDGDTLRIDYNGTDTYVRLIGIDTPESVNPDETKNSEEGKIASAYTKSLVSENVYLDFDVQSRDKYDRLLAYVYLPNGVMLNDKIIRDGYAYVMTVIPNVKHVILFTDAFQYARENNLGLWTLEGANE